MATRDDVESYLIRLGREFEEVDDGMWIVDAGDRDAPVVAHYSPPVLVLRLKMMELPAEVADVNRAGLYRRLLELNANDIVHGSFGLEEDAVVLSDAFLLETLDFQELQASYESMTFAASEHLEELAGLIAVAHED